MASLYLPDSGHAFDGVNHIYFDAYQDGIVLSLLTLLMLLFINSSKTIGDLQDKFNECFPSYQMEFYRNKHEYNLQQPLDARIKIGDILKSDVNVAFDIKSWCTARELQAAFKKSFNLLIKIYHLHNGGWMVMEPHQKLNIPSLLSKRVNAVEDSFKDEETLSEL
jgi:hypothetical protein